MPIKSPPTTSQHLSIQSFALSAAVLPAIPMSSFEPPIRPFMGGGVRVDLRGRKWYKSESRPHFYSSRAANMGCTVAKRAFGRGAGCYSSGSVSIFINSICFSPSSLPWRALSLAHASHPFINHAATLHPAVSFPCLRESGCIIIL